VRRYASLADFYYAFGMTLLRGRYHKILWPRRQLAKVANGFCGYPDALVCLDPGFIGQTPSAMWSAAMFFGLYRITTPPTPVLSSQA
jgi:hypothetical protein